jgi:hypothetical protein
VDIEIKKLKKLIKFLQNNGVSHYKSGDIELTLSPSSLFPDKKTKQTEQQDATVEGSLTDEDIMLWSAPSFGADMEGGN